MVMAPANTGRESNNSRAVKNTDQTNRFSRSQVIPGDRRLITVVRKLMAPKMDEIPAIWSEKIARSTAFPEWATPLLSGGYTVQPVPTPASINDLESRSSNDGGSSQSDKLLSRGNDISGAPIRSGTIQFPKPPIIVGITKKKIITKAWAVTTTLYSCGVARNTPGEDNSSRIMSDRPVPIRPAQIPKIKYKVPMSL